MALRDLNSFLNRLPAAAAAATAAAVACYLLPQPTNSNYYGALCWKLETRWKHSLKGSPTIVSDLNYDRRLSRVILDDPTSSIISGLRRPIIGCYHKKSTRIILQMAASHFYFRTANVIIYMQESIVIYFFQVKVHGRELSKREQKIELKST